MNSQDQPKDNAKDQSKDQPKDQPQDKAANRTTVLIGLAADRNDDITKIELQLAAARLRLKDGSTQNLPIAHQRIVWDFASSKSLSFLANAPIGNFTGLSLEIERASFFKRDDKPDDPSFEWRGTMSARAAITFSEGETTRLLLRVNIAALLQNMDKPDEALSVKSEVIGQTLRHRVAGNIAETITLATPSFDLRGGQDLTLRLGRDAFPRGTDVRLRRTPKSELPPLFRGQQALGSPVEIRANAQLGGEVELTVAYDDAARAATGLRPQQLIVLQLNDERTLYRELRPFAVDADNHTLSVRTRSLSTFFAGTPGVFVDLPTLTVTAGGEAVAYATGRQTVVSGRATDTRANIELRGANALQQWVAQGTFLFEGVALQISDTLVELHATVEGLVPHIITLTIRRAFPHKFLTRTWPGHAPRVAYGTRGTPFVTMTLLDERNNVEGVGLRVALQSVGRRVPTLFSYNADGDGWHTISLLPADFIENEMAKAGIQFLEDRTGQQIPLNGQYPESVRALRSLEDFVATLGQDTLRHLGQTGASLLALLEARKLVYPHHAISYDSPIVALPDDDREAVGVAFVLASQAGREALADSPRMQQAFEPLFRGRLLSGEFDNDQILAGTLFYVRADANTVLATETVAENVWCASLAMQINPETGQPAILALEVEPDLGGDGLQRPRSRLTLFQRRADGTWRREDVLGDRPVLDADLAFSPGGLPHVVAALAGDSVTKTHLVYLNRRDNWIPQPVRWALDEVFNNLDLGMWPSIVLDEAGQPVIGFAFYTVGALFHMVGVRNGNGWRTARVTRTAMRDITGSAASALNSDVPNDLLVRSGLFFGISYADHAPAIAMEAPRKLWFAYGNGVMKLAEVDLDTLDIQRVRLDVDRTTGFAPAITARHHTPTVVYKDCFGGTVNAEGEVFTSQQDIQFLAGGQGLTYPDEPVLAALKAIGWRRSERAVFLGDFGAHTPLQCQVFLDSAGLIATALFIDLINTLAGRPSNATADIVDALSDHFMPSLLMTGTFEVDLFTDPLTLQFALINDRFPNEEIERLVITKREKQPATVLAVERSGRVPACGIDQKTWDALGVLFDDFELDPKTLLGGATGAGLEHARMTGMRLSMRAEHFGDQQGAVRFTLAIPNITAEGSKAGVGWNAYSTQPSEFSFVLAPFVVDNNLQWYVRESHGRVGHIEVDVDLVFSWVGLVSVLIIGLLPFVLIADPVADSVFTDLANERRKGFEIKGFVRLVRKVYERFARARLFLGDTHQPGALDSAFFLRHNLVGLFRTARPADFVPAPITVSVIPDPQLNMGAVVVGGAAIERRFLIANDGALPVMIRDVTLRPQGQDFRISSSHAWPQVLESGAAITVTIAFTPRLPVGERTTTLEVRVLNAQTITRNVRARVGAPAGVPVLILNEANDPARLFNFGIADVGSTRRAYVELANRGNAAINVTALTIEPDARSNGVFMVAPAAPFPVPANESRFLELTFTATAMIAQGHQARLLVDTNHANHPRQELALRGTGLSASLLLSVAALDFGTTALGRTLSVTVYNTGAAALRIAGESFQFLDDADAESANFQLLDGSQPVPQIELVILPGQAKLFNVQFRPQGAGDYNARMRLRSNDPMNPVVELMVTGRGA